MNSEEFIKLVNKNLVDDIYVKTNIFEDNNIGYTLIPYLHKEVVTYFEPYNDIFKVVVKLDDGIYYFAATNLGTGWTSSSDGGVYYDTIGLNTDCIEDILNRTTKDELVEDLTRQYCYVVNDIAKF